MNLADAMERKSFSDGECIIKQVSLNGLSTVQMCSSILFQGDNAETFYLVESGKVTITKEDPVSQECPLLTFLANDILLTEQPRGTSSPD